MEIRQRQAETAQSVQCCTVQFWQLACIVNNSKAGRITSLTDRSTIPMPNDPHVSSMMDAVIHGVPGCRKSFGPDNHEPGWAVPIDKLSFCSYAETRLCFHAQQPSAVFVSLLKRGRCDVGIGRACAGLYESTPTH